MTEHPIVLGYALRLYLSFAAPEHFAQFRSGILGIARRFSACFGTGEHHTAILSGVKQRFEFKTVGQCPLINRVCFLILVKIRRQG